MTHARPRNLADPTNCRECGGDGIACDWRDIHGVVDYELCQACKGTGKIKPLADAQRVSDYVAAASIGGLLGIALFMMVVS